MSNTIRLVQEFFLQNGPMIKRLHGLNSSLNLKLKTVKSIFQNLQRQLKVRTYWSIIEKDRVLIKTDGIVAETAQKIVNGKKNDLDKARAIYEWIVENTFRDPKVRGCGVGDISSMLRTENLGGKCADLNGLFVGLARAAGLPARDVYGIRCAKSAEFNCLGRTGDISGSQHCRAEVYLSEYGWVPVDPADVRKVILEENPQQQLTMEDPQVKKAHAKLFGSWEMNWMPYNYAHDVRLPKSNGPELGFLMYPQAETSNGRKDCLDAKNFKYTITTTET